MVIRESCVTEILVQQKILITRYIYLVNASY